MVVESILADSAERRRLAQVQDLTGAIVSLASDASALTTGSARLVDGGWTAD